MSDSDDTDILLLIPPNYYLTIAEELMQRRQFSSLEELTPLKLQYKQKISRTNLKFNSMDLASWEDYDALAMPPATKKAELDHLNARLYNIERDNVATFDNASDISCISKLTAPTQFSPKYMNSSFKEQPPAKSNCNTDISDISTISTNTVRTEFGSSKANREPLGMVHSTPKNTSASFKKQPDTKENNNFNQDKVLSEIDNFLVNDGIANNRSYLQQHHSDVFLLEKQRKRNEFSDVKENFSTQVNSLPTVMQTLMPDKIHASSCYKISKADNNLISLSEIWGKNGHDTAIATYSESNLKEEQLRRQHLERTIRQLQVQLLEYQQRLSVAIEVDRTKDSALNNAQIENESLNQDLHYIRKSLQESEQHRKTYNDKIEALQKELAQAVNLASKFQDKTEKLEQEISVCSRKTNESCNQYKQKVEELEIKAHACQRSEELAINELQKFRDKYAKSEHLYEKTKLRCEELEKENSTLRHQKDMLQEYHQKQKNRAENLDVQRKSLQESLANLTENENTLKKKLELQQKSLKSHYQQQLENVVAQKLKEFQEQLDKTEETLKSEAKERERLIAERAVKQLELINEKNELELNLLQEKHNEEVELYRIQLANASKKIDEMEMKLNVYKSKRADIAEKLHNVMETQWQKALEILTSPHNTTQTTQNETDYEPSSPENNETHAKMNKENEFQTPKSINKKNNLNLIQNHETSPEDKLQAYIELLLSKSPTDFNRLDEILSLTSKAKETKDKLEKSNKRHCYSKPPWKA